MSKRSLSVILISNLAILIIAVFQNQSISSLVLLFWAQSLFIGIFNWLRILSIKHLSSKYGILKNSVPNIFLKFFIASFFAIHYGLFQLVHLVFILFILNYFSDFSSDVSILLIVSVFVGELFQFIQNFRSDRNVERNIVFIMFLPYPRILVMHAFIIVSVWLLFTQSGGVFIAIFMALKTVGELVGQGIESAIEKHSLSA
jgi:hypothetical protein